MGEAAWRHGEAEDDRCAVLAAPGYTQQTRSCGCTTPTPDPTSPCGLGCGQAADGPVHGDPSGWPWGSRHLAHPHQPTRCLTCGHAIEEVRG